MAKILIADQDVSFRNALALLISHRLKIQDIDQAGDIDTLICTISTIPPEILLLDWRLIGAPALETCRLLRKAYPELKIVLMSMDPDNIEAAHSVDATFIHKAAKPEDVIATLEKALRINRQEGENQARYCK
jgi:DNA-binding NarL/FixJ family response regulator